MHQNIEAVAEININANPFSRNEHFTHQLTSNGMQPFEVQLVQELKPHDHALRFQHLSHHNNHFSLPALNCIDGQCLIPTGLLQFATHLISQSIYSVKRLIAI